MVQRPTATPMEFVRRCLGPPPKGMLRGVLRRPLEWLIALGLQRCKQVLFIDVAKGTAYVPALLAAL